MACMHRYDLAERLTEVGLQQYARPLRAMGFDDVTQLLSLQASHACTHVHPLMCMACALHARR